MKSRHIFIKIITLGVVLSFLLVGCSNIDTVKNNKIPVMTSVYPMAEFTKQVGGDRVEVMAMVPSGTEPHSWEPTSEKLRDLYRSKLFVYSGGGMEPWAEKIKESVKDKPIVILEAGAGLFTDSEKIHIEHKDDPHNHDVHNHGDSDPHIWLDPTLAIKQVMAIRDALINVDPAGEETYKKNAANYIAELDQLDKDFMAMRKNIVQRNFVTTHKAFSYLAKRYDLDQVGIMGLTPGVEPTPAEIAKFINFIMKHNIKYIFAEPLVTSKVMGTLTEATGIKILVLDPLEGLDKNSAASNDNYLSIMKRNLANLKTALEQ